MALQPLFANIPQAHLIHDDLIVAATTNAEHNQAIKAVMNVISSAGITLNPDKCTFGVPNSGAYILDQMVYDPILPKLKRSTISRHHNPDELTSFPRMMQSNSDFIPNFAKLAAPLRELMKKKSDLCGTKHAKQPMESWLPDSSNARCFNTLRWMHRHFYSWMHTRQGSEQC